MKMSPRRIATIVSMAMVMAGALVPARADTQSCAQGTPGGGDWPTFNQNLSSTNVQGDEHVLSSGNVSQLQLAWLVPDSGYFSQPIVAGTCVYLTPFGTSGSVEALDTSTGGIVWKVAAPLAGQTFGATVQDGTLFMNFPDNGHPKAAALRAADGHLLWTSDEITFGYQANQLASARTFDGMQLVFTTGPDFDPAARPGYALIDVATGQTLHAQTVIPTAQLDAGAAGGGVWGTPAIDADSGYAFVGTANPDSRTSETRYDNAIIKIDVAKARDAGGNRVASAEITNPRFGQIAGIYKGESDTIVDGGYNQPACSALGQQASTPLVNVVCLQTDIDFGNGPTLWRDSFGNLMLSEIQKSGVVHTLYADNMERAWSEKIAPDSTLTITGGNDSYMATDGSTLYVLTNPGVLWAIDGVSGGVKWAVPTGGTVFAYGNVSVTNGVVYAMGSDGPHAWDAATGTLLWSGSDALKMGNFCTGATGSIAIAHHMLFATCPRNELAENTAVIMAFKLP